MTMLRAMLWFHWRACRNWIVAAAVVAAGLPVVSLRLSWPRDPSQMASFLAQLEAWGVFYPVAAAIVGLVMAVIIWQADRRGRFVYAATLPIERWRYVWLRFVAGAAWIVGLGVVLWVASLVALATVSLPDTLRTFPTVLAVKFTLAAVSVFAIYYSITTLPASTTRIASRVVLGLVVLQVLALLLGVEGNWLVAVGEALIGRWGPLALLGGRWMLIDV